VDDSRRCLSDSVDFIRQQEGTNHEALTHPRWRMASHRTACWYPQVCHAPLTWAAARDKTDLGERPRRSTKPAAHQRQAQPTGNAVEPDVADKASRTCAECCGRGNPETTETPIHLPNPPMDLDRIQPKISSTTDH